MNKTTNAINKVELGIPMDNPSFSDFFAIPLKVNVPVELNLSDSFERCPASSATIKEILWVPAVISSTSYCT